MEFIFDCQAAIIPLRKQEDIVISHRLNNMDSCKEIHQWLCDASKQRKSILNQCIQMMQDKLNSIQGNKSSLEKEKNWLKSQLEVEEIIHTNSIKKWKERCDRYRFNKM